MNGMLTVDFTLPDATTPTAQLDHVPSVGEIFVVTSDQPPQPGIPSVWTYTVASVTTNITTDPITGWTQKGIAVLLAAH